MTLLVQTYLLEKNLKSLEQDHGIKAKVCENAPYKFSLNYDQLNAHDGDPVARQCRGLILRSKDGSPISRDNPMETVVVARPFDRFLNYGQEHADSVNFNDSSCAFYEKLDGSLNIIYFDDIKNEWHVATRSISEANAPVDGFETHTFRSLFEKCLCETTGYQWNDWIQHLNPEYTYMFELTSPINRIVVYYSDYRITLLGVRHTQSGQEYSVQSSSIPAPKVQQFHFGNIDEMLDFVKQQNPSEMEGVVACDPKFRRVKVKNPEYVAYNKVRDRVANSPVAIMEIILSEKMDDVLPMLPEELQNYSQKLQKGFHKLCKEQDGALLKALHQADTEAPVTIRSPSLLKEHRKQFAFACDNLGLWKNFAFARYDGKVEHDFASFMKNAQDKQGSYPRNLMKNLVNAIEKKYA